jgi:hypothetical protein
MGSQTAIQLQHSLAERLPTLRLLSQLEPQKAGPLLPTGVAHMDDLLGGGLPKGAITELVNDNKSAGSGLVLCSILRHAHPQWAGLIDGRDSFDPASLDFDLSRVLWVRCREAAEALKAADLLLRDGNLPLLLLDLAFNPLPELRKTPANVWYRLQRLVEHQSTALLVLTPRPMISSAKVRLHLDGNFTLEDLEQPQTELLPKLKFMLANKRDSTAHDATPQLA